MGRVLYFGSELGLHHEEVVAEAAVHEGHLAFAEFLLGDADFFCEGGLTFVDEGFSVHQVLVHCF